MAKTQLSRETLLPAIAAHVLEHGLGGASLRPLAKAAGTSDRMLIYHFGNKEALITELLGYVAALYSGALDAMLGADRPATRQECFARILGAGSDPAMSAFLMLWWDIVAGAARGLPGYRAAAEAMMTKQLAWLEAQMPEGDPDPSGGARYLMTVIEGTLMLAAVGHGDTAQQGLLAGGLLATYRRAP